MRGGQRKYIDMTGQDYGRLHVLYRIHEDSPSADRRPKWVCKCACGETTIVIGANLRTGMTRSCGCLRRETSAQNGRKRKAEAAT